MSLADIDKSPIAIPWELRSDPHGRAQAEASHGREKAAQPRRVGVQLAEEIFAVYTKGMASWVDKASKSAPAGSDAAINAFKSTIAATTAAFDQFQKASKQVVNLADANVRRAAATATKTVKGRKAA